MNYKIIQNEDMLNEFIEWLPELDRGEQYYGCLFARKKYDKNGILKSDKAQIKRFVSDKKYLKQKIKQLEVEVGNYTVDGKHIPQETLAMYIMPNPRSLLRASVTTSTELQRMTSSLLFDENSKIPNPKSIAFNSLQISCSRKICLDFNFDFSEVNIVEQMMILQANLFYAGGDVINKNACRILRTRGGCHLLVEMSKIDERYKKTYHKKIKNLGADVTGDVLMPVPGTTQGGFVPYFID